MSDNKDYYQILGVNKNASEEEIKKKFRELSLKWHPDKFSQASESEQKDAEEKFKEISEAYNVLSDKEKRRAYDMGDMDFPDMNDFDVFNIFRKKHKKQTNDIKVNVVLTVEECYSGCTKDVEVSLPKSCTYCNGTGSSDGKRHKCTECGGSGFQQRHTFQNHINYIEQTTCHHCHGSGTIIKEKCSHCSGTGITYDKKIISLNIPKGVSQGMVLTMKGVFGEWESGDLFVLIDVKQNENDYFRIDPATRNVVHFETIPFNIALCGTEIDIRCLDGNKKTLKLSELTLNDTTYKLTGKGLPHPNGGQPSDFYVIIKHQYPKKLNKTQKEYLRKIKW